MNYKLEEFGLLHRRKRIWNPKDAVKVGDFVKLIFLFDKAIEGVHAERLWVEIKSESDGKYLGVVDNEPVYLKELDGKKIEFSKKNIFDKYDD